MWLNLLRVFIHIPAGVIIFTLHGYAAAAVCKALGDHGPKDQGRMSLNPFKHFEPIGFLCFWFFRLGWSKPVTGRPFVYKGNRRKSELIVAILPLTVCLLASALFAAAAHIFGAGVPYGVLLEGGGHRVAYDLLTATAFYSLCFVLFNLVPVYPMDGAKILAAVKPGWWLKIQAKERVAQTILVFALLFNIVGWLIFPIANGILSFLNS